MAQDGQILTNFIDLSIEHLPLKARKWSQLQLASQKVLVHNREMLTEKMIQTMHVLELAEKITHNPEKIFLIDCREVEEWQKGHLAHGHLWPLSTFPAAFHQLATQIATPGPGGRPREIIIMCRSGVRSNDLCHFLVGQGVGPVYNLAGGILAWYQAQLPTIT